jgi:hypothetical protein
MTNSSSVLCPKNTIAHFPFAWLGVVIANNEQRDLARNVTCGCLYIECCERRDLVFSEIMKEL